MTATDWTKSYEQLVAEHNESERAYRVASDRALVALRHKLREYDPSLPSEFDGAAWAPIEQACWPEWMQPASTV